MGPIKLESISAYNILFRKKFQQDEIDLGNLFFKASCTCVSISCISTEISVKVTF